MHVGQDSYSTTVTRNNMLFVSKIVTSSQFNSIWTRELSNFGKMAHLVRPFRSQCFVEFWFDALLFSFLFLCDLNPQGAELYIGVSLFNAGDILSISYRHSNDGGKVTSSHRSDIAMNYSRFSYGLEASDATSPSPKQVTTSISPLNCALQFHRDGDGCLVAVPHSESMSHLAEILSRSNLPSSHPLASQVLSKSFDFRCGGKSCASLTVGHLPVVCIR
jgi:hypothetical protein